MPHSPRAKRTFFISATCLAICVMVYRTVRHYLEWHDVREDLHDWAETLDRERGKTEIYVGSQINEEFFEVLTAEAVADSRVCLPLIGLVDILIQPKNALTKQYAALFEMEGVELEFRDDALKAIAHKAMSRKWV